MKIFAEISKNVSQHAKDSFGCFCNNEVEEIRQIKLDKILPWQFYDDIRTTLSF
jgi:hypothetical protein